LRILEAQIARDLTEYAEWESNRNSFWTNFKKNVNPIVVIGFIAIVLIGSYAITQSEINPMYVYALLGVILVVIILKTDRGKEKQPIPENVIKIIGLALMKRKIGVEYPNGTIITPLGYCKMRFQGDWGQPYGVWKWEVGFSIVYPTGLKETVLVIFHPYEGYITGIVGKAAGYKGEDSNDLKVLMPLSLAVQEEKPKK